MFSARELTVCSPARQNFFAATKVERTDHYRWYHGMKKAMTRAAVQADMKEGKETSDSANPIYKVNVETPGPIRCTPLGEKRPSQGVNQRTI